MDYETEARKLRFLSKIKTDEKTACWNWQANKIKKPFGLPYGMFYWGLVNGKEKMMKAHRASWIIHNGPVPGAQHVLHRCHNPSCCNPDHLYTGSHKQNMRDRDTSGRTSRGDKRYNWKRSQTLIDGIIVEFKLGKKIEAICETLKIGRNTFFRARKQSQELRDLMAETRRERRIAFAAEKPKYALIHRAGCNGPAFLLTRMPQTKTARNSDFGRHLDGSPIAELSTMVCETCGTALAESDILTANIVLYGGNTS